MICFHVSRMLTIMVLDSVRSVYNAIRLASIRIYGRYQWRAPILCNSTTLPSHAALEAQAESLARFAAISQHAGLVPIVEPDVDFGEDASLARSVEVHVKAISMIYARCMAYGVLTEGESLVCDLQ